MTSHVMTLEYKLNSIPTGSVVLPSDRTAGQARLLVLHLCPPPGAHSPHRRLPDLQCRPQVLPGLPAPQQLQAEDLQCQAGGEKESKGEKFSLIQDQRPKKCKESLQS